MPLHANSLEFYFITPCTNNRDKTEPENFLARHYLFISGTFWTRSNMSIVITRPVKSDWGHFNCCDNINHLTVYKLKKNGLIV